MSGEPGALAERRKPSLPFLPGLPFLARARLRVQAPSPRYLRRPFGSSCPGSPRPLVWSAPLRLPLTRLLAPALAPLRMLVPHPPPARLKSTRRVLVAAPRPPDLCSQVKGGWQELTKEVWIEDGGWKMGKWTRAAGASSLLPTLHPA